jgi:hypothetical protein
VTSSTKEKISGAIDAHWPGTATGHATQAPGTGGASVARSKIDGQIYPLGTRQPFARYDSLMLACSSPSTPCGLRRARSAFDSCVAARRAGGGEAWWARQDSNLQPDRYERPALTIELQALSEEGLPQPCAAGTCLQRRSFWSNQRPQRSLRLRGSQANAGRLRLRSKSSSAMPMLRAFQATPLRKAAR